MSSCPIFLLALVIEVAIDRKQSRHLFEKQDTVASLVDDCLRSLCRYLAEIPGADRILLPAQHQSLGGYRATTMVGMGVVVLP